MSKPVFSKNCNQSARYSLGFCFMWPTCGEVSHSFQDTRITNGDRFATLMVCVSILPETVVYGFLRKWYKDGHFQLDSVPYGGYTVFPATFTTAIPRKGSAIFWFNALSDGTPDFSTAHAECTVVLGEKWAEIAPSVVGHNSFSSQEKSITLAICSFYKWISFYDQLSTRKCLLKAKGRLQVTCERQGRRLIQN